MTQVTHIHLSTQSVNTHWQSENLVQFVENELHICLKKSNESPLRQIQKAARKIETLGVKNARLTGEYWDEATQLLDVN
ncbi:MAG: hypothetical protein QMC13_08245 [Colwellia sp.]